VGFKDWFQKKLKNHSDEDISSSSKSQQEKDNLSFVEPELQYPTQTESGLPSEREDRNQNQTQSELRMNDDNLEFIQNENQFQDRQSDENIHHSRELLSQSKEPDSASLHSSDRDDYATSLLASLPELWTGKEMKLHIVADYRDATWIMNRILQQVESGLINADVKTKELTHLCDMAFVLRVSEGLSGFPAAITAINPTLSYLLTTIKTEAILRRKRRLRTL